MELRGRADHTEPFSHLALHGGEDHCMVLSTRDLIYSSEGAVVPHEEELEL